MLSSLHISEKEYLIVREGMKPYAFTFNNPSSSDSERWFIS